MDKKTLNNKIFVIGSSNTDMVVKGTKIPPPGETVIGGEFLMNAGGKGANQAVAATKLGANLVFVCKLGDDIFGHRAIDEYQALGICTDFITIEKHVSSGVALIMVDENGQNCISVASGANAFLCPNDLEKVFSVITKHDLLMLQLEIPLETVYYCIEKANSIGAKVILNPAPAVKIDISFLSLIYLLTPNQHEAESIAGIAYTNLESLEAIARWFHARGLKNLLITLGEKGVFFSDGTSYMLFSAPKVMAIDTTAAGDIFNGALVFALSRNDSLVDAIPFACRAAALSVTKLGAQSSAPTFDELQNFNFKIQ